MKARQIEIHPEAVAEAEAAIDWYAERSSRAPAAFMEELDKAIESIREAPKRWPIFDQDCRRFPFSLFRRLLRKIRQSRADPGRRAWSPDAWLLAIEKSLGSKAQTGCV